MEKVLGIMQEVINMLGISSMGKKMDMEYYVIKEEILFIKGFGEMTSFLIKL